MNTPDTSPVPNSDNRISRLRLKSIGAKNRTNKKVGEKSDTRKRLQRQLRRIDKIREKRQAKFAAERIETEVLTLKGVANYLHCSVQAIRNIPKDLLPRREGPGKYDLILKEDVVEYVRQHPKINPAADELIRDIENDLLESKPDSGKRRRNKEKKR